MTREAKKRLDQMDLSTLSDVELKSLAQGTEGLIEHFKTMLTAAESLAARLASESRRRGRRPSPKPMTQPKKEKAL